MTYMSLIKKKNHIKYKNVYEKIFSYKNLPFEMKKNSSLSVKYPIFSKKIIMFKHNSFIISKHKKNINATICLSSYISKNRFNLIMPIHYPAVKFDSNIF